MTRDHGDGLEIMMYSRGRPKFGFGFGAERCHLATFGRLSVSAEREKLTFGQLSVSAESDLDFRSQPKVKSIR